MPAATPLPSSVPLVKSTLKAKLEADSGLDGVQIAYGRLGEPAKAEAIVLGDIPAGWTRAWTGLRPSQPRDESYPLELFIESVKPGKDQQTVTERVFDLLAVVDAVLRSTPTWLGLPSATVLNLELRTVAFHEFMTEQPAGRGARIDAFVDIHARV